MMNKAWIDCVLRIMLLSTDNLMFRKLDLRLCLNLVSSYLFQVLCDTEPCIP